MRVKFVIIFLMLKSPFVFSQQFNCEVKIAIDSVMKNFKESDFFDSEKLSDECKLIIISELATRYINTNHTDYLIYLSNLYGYSDGVFGDQMYTSGGKIFNNSLKKWFKYLYRNKKSKTAISFFVLSVSEQIVRNKDTKTNLFSKMDDLKLNIAEKKFLSNLKNQIGDAILNDEKMNE